MATKTHTGLTVCTCESVTDNTVLLSMHPNGLLPAVKPGQFAQLSAPGIFLKHPFSIHDMENGRILFLIQNVGPASNALSKVVPGDVIDAVLPLGNGFDIDGSFDNALLVGGGVGIAPLMLLGKTLLKKGKRFSFLLGARSGGQLCRIEEFGSLAPVYVSTQDGSVGEHGLVTEHSILNANGFDQVFCCGPTPMMKAVAAYARERGIPCQVSLEHTMACGLGACLCCVEDTVDGNVCICKEGPVFDTRKLKWQI